MKDIIVINDNRFKSVFVSVNMLLPLKACETGKNALLAMVLKKSSSLFETEKDLERDLAKLYNTSIDVNVDKIDNLYNVQFGMEILNRKYMSEEDVDRAKDIFVRLICSPKFVDGRFKEDIFIREKETLLQKINEERDNKKKYALNKLESQMFEGTDYGVSVLGNYDQIQSITNNELSKHYDYLVNNSKIVVAACGNLNQMEELPKEIYNRICEKRGKIGMQNIQTVNKKAGDKINIGIEKQDINQSIITVGLRIENMDKEEVYAAMLYNTILGATPASKLFQNVREKQSLAYFAKSLYKRHKNVIYIFAGIAPDKYEKAKDVIFEQVESIKAGDISEMEFSAAKSSLISTFKEARDTKVSQLTMYINNEIYFGHEVSIEEMVDAINKLEIRNVINIANKVKITDVFLLGGASNV